uniref:tRNA nuclease WapA n=1 Tax=Wolbachia endosymbiont of Aleurodicus dispersus TaxID=1288877 RepID=A0A3B0JH63_9RICK
MPNFYKLSFAKQALPFNGGVKLYQDNSRSGDPLQFYALHKEGLDSYRYDNNTWKETLSMKGLHARQIYFADVLGNGELMLIAKTQEGISFYQHKNNEFSLLSKSENFTENWFSDIYYDWNKPGSVIKFGRFYYNSSLVGILTNRRKYGTKLYAIMKDELLKGRHSIFVLKTDLSILGNCSHAEFALSDLKQSGQENIVIHGNNGLNIYGLNQRKRLEHLMQVPSSAKLDDSEEELFFPNLTGQSYRDIVLLNASGLFVYQYNSSLSNYGLIDYQPSFSKLKGWEQEYINSIQFEDIDLDGREDMLFTGPSGINLLSFNNRTNQWQSLLDNSELTISQRHSDVVKVFPASPPITKYPIVFTKYKNQLHSANIFEIKDSLSLEEELEIHSTSSQVATSKVVPQVSKVHLEEEKPPVLLRDQLDCSSIVDAVDKNTGKPKFKLPLIDLSNLLSDLKLDFFYDGNSKASDILGLGWSLPKNFIMMDHQSSIFPEDEKYYVVLQDLPQQLIFDSSNSTDNVYYFKLSTDQPDLRIRYHKNEERWEINSSGIKQIYGNTDSVRSGSINWEIAWENWRGVGSSSTRQKKLATGWYLAEVRDKNNNVVRYTYDIVNVSVPNGESFTQEIYLKTVSDNQGNEVNFKYSNKEEGEYNLLPLIDKEGNLNTRKVQTRYLSGYKVSTPSYQQDISFVYKVEDRKRLLSKIKQEGDSTNQPILQFSYSKSHMLEKVVLPTGTSIQFDYQLLEKDSSINERIGYRYDVGEDHRVNYVDDYVLVSYMDRQGQVVLRMFNQEMTEELYSSLPLLGRGLAKSYGIVLVNGFLAVVLSYSTDQELHLLRQEEGEWVSKCYVFNEKAIINPGKDFIVVVDNDSAIEVISWNKDSKEWKKDKPFADSGKNRVPLLLRAFGRGFIFYDNDLLSVGYEDREGRWKYNTITSIPGVINDIRETLDKFDLDNKRSDDFFAFFKNYALQVSNNLLFLNRWKAEGMKLYSVIDLFVLDSSYKLAKYEQKKILQDDLSQNLDWQENGNGSSFKFAYELVNDKFKVIAKDVSSHIVDEIHKEIDNDNLRKDAKDKVLEINTKSFEDREKKPFLLNPHKYLAALNSQVVNSTKLTFTGDNWKEGKVSEEELKQEKFSIPLGKEFVLKKEGLNSSIKLYKKSNDKEELAKDLGVNQLNQTLIRYPIYLAYQPNGYQVSVVKFLNNGSISGPDKLHWGENLSSFSSYQTLVTSIDRGYDSKTLVFRKQIGHLFPNPVITKVTVSFDDVEKRVTGYEYSEAKALGNIVYYENVSIVPGNDKGSFGWIGETKNLSSQAKRFFNSQGELIKTLKFEYKQANDTKVDKENLYLNTTLLDKTGRLEIAQFFPCEIADEEVGYYGFEGYEVNRIGEKSSSLEKKWVFDEKDVVREGFSFTGRNYLSLSGKSLVGTFQPNDQNQEYIASCWIRPKSEMFKLGDIVPYLKAIVSVEKRNETVLPLGEVKLQVDNWFYLEVIVDLFYAKEVLKNLNEVQTNKTLVEKEDTKLTTSIIVAPGTNTTIDVDHVRFSPLKSSFKANVYDPKTKQVTEVISASGLVERQIYDKYQKQVGSISGYGELKELGTYTKSSRITKLKSSVVIQPESGFYEDFAPESFNERWKIDSADAWQISPGRLQHLTSGTHTLQLNSSDIDRASCGMRFCFSLQSDGAVMNFSNNLKAIRTGNRAEIVFSRERRSIPLDGELLIVAEGKRIFVWVDGGLCFDGSLNVSLFNLEIGGRAKISNLIVFSQPSVEVTYFNKLNEKVQKIVLEGENAAIVTEYLYDELGRQSITTQPAGIKSSDGQSVLAYRNNFVTNGNPYTANSVWKTGKLEGDAARIIGEYGYSQVKYCDNPLNEKCVVGLPGRELSVSGPYAKRFSSLPNDSFITNPFPSENHSYRVEHKPGNVKDISVFDSKDNRVAWYISTPKSESLLSTYEYGENGKLVKSLPPIYHEKVGTFYKNSQLNSTSREEKSLQDSLGINISYDQKGNIITKTAPDSGKIENIYDKDGLLRFVLHSSNEKVDNTVYFDYDELGRLRSTGEVISPTPKEELLSLELSGNNTRAYQEFYYSDAELQPLLRGKIARTITFNSGEPLIEESVVNIDEETISKRIIIPTKDSEKPILISVNKRYEAGKLREVEYPIDLQDRPFRIMYRYDKLGRVEGIGIRGKENLFASFSYNADGQLNSEKHLPDLEKNFTREYGYNSAGFLTELKDKFLTEKVYYTEEKSYGGYGYGDGTITRTEFKATWHENCDLGLKEHSFVSKDITPEESATCFHKLKKGGYLNDGGHQAKVYYPDLETKFPTICSDGLSGSHIRNTLGKEGFPVEYGHSYDYGNYQELTKAKYYVGREIPMPLQPDSFAREIARMNETASRDIWKRLKESWYLIEDNEKVDVSLGHGKRGKSFIKGTLVDDLKSVNADYGWYELPLEGIFIEYFAQKRDLSSLKISLRDAFVRWVNIEEENANKIVKMLEEKGYFNNPFAKEFNEILERYQPYVHEIVSVLSEHFAKRLGEAEFDFESYSIDANGNHGHFYTGFDRYEIDYRNNTNQVSNVKFQSFTSSKREQNFSIRHDSRGNVIQALHKGIEQIDYHPVSNRATKIKLTDGRTLEFYYDARGERVLKRVSDKAGETTKEIYYIRDEFGRALVEREITYIAGGLRPDVSVTAYIYGPRGLFGFIRNNEFYSVITDHEGSIRLVVKGDEVVAAYDYLPYGNLMRKYESDPEGKIAYCYTGQEWDEEIGLYNYHARFYDPSIGRFYQIDPKEQYFSPYKYAGNSPVSMVDPDGELAFLALLPFIIAGATAGGYLGGAAANNRWDPTEWDFKSKGTWVGMVGGGISGAFLPVGFAGSVSALTAVGFSTGGAIATTTGFGVGGAYLGVGAANNEWNPTKWDLKSPATWNAGFHGFALGSSIPAGIHGARIAYGKLSSHLSRGAFISGGGAFGAGSFYISGSANNWDFSKPGMWYGVLQALDDATNLPVFARSAFKSARRGFIKNMPKGKNVEISHYNIDSLHPPLEMRFGSGLLLKGYGLLIASIALTAANEGRLDMSNPGTYFDIVRQMAMVNQHWLIGKNFYRERKIGKELKIEEKHNKRIKGLSREIAKDAIKWLESARMEKVNNAEAANAGNRKNLHTAVSLAIDDNHAIVGFSGNKGSGFILSYSRNRGLGGFERVVGLELNDNSKISPESRKNSKFNSQGKLIQETTDKAGKVSDNQVEAHNDKVVLNPDPEINKDITKKIEMARETIDGHNKEVFRDVIGEARLMRLLGNLDEVTKELVIKDLTEIINERRHFSKGSLEMIMRKHFIPKDSEIQRISGEIKSGKEELKGLKRSSKNESPKERKDRLFAVQRQEDKIKSLDKQKTEREKNIREELEQTASAVWNAIKFPMVTLPTWEFSNCAEPHAITAFSRANELFGIKTQKSIKYLATYRTEGLEAFPACLQCKSTVKYVDNVITEPGWNGRVDDLQGLVDRFNSKLDDRLKNIQHFPTPMTNGSLKAENSSSTRTKRSIFIGHGEVETIPNPRTRSSKLTSISNQLSKESIVDVNKKVTSSATRTSSWINDLFGWMRSSVSGLLGYELPKVVSSTKSPISQVDAPIDINGTIMLLDVLIRKVTGQKYISTADQSISPLEAQGYALNITKGFEKVVEQAGLKSGVSMHRLNIDFVEIQKEVTGKIMSGKFDEISGVLSSYLEKACPSREVGCPGKLSSKKFDKFMVEFNSRLNVVLNRSIQQILHNGDGRLEVDGAKQMNLEPQSYLSNASVQGHSKDKVSTCLSDIGVTKLGGNLNR